MVASSPLFIPLDGRIPSQNVLISPLDGTEVMEIVWPGNNAQGNTYQVTTDTLAAFISAFPVLNTEIITAGTTYDVSPTDTRILVNKILSSPTAIVFPKAATLVYKQPVFIKDFKGDSFTNNITITFSNGELCDGQSTIIIDNDYGWTTITPYPLSTLASGAWYLT